MRSRARPGTRIGLLALTALYGLPLAYLVATSLKTSTQLFASPAGLAFKPHLAAYRAVLNNGFFHAVLNSAIIALGTAGLVLALGTPAAYWLSRSRSRLVNVGLASLILLQMVPQATTVIPLFRIMGKWGLIGTLQSVILADTALLLPFAVIILRPFSVSVPNEIEEAARVDSSSNLRIFLSIYLPLVRNGLLTVGTLVWIIAWGEFLYAITFITSSDKLPAAGLLAQQVGQFGIDWGPLTAVAVLVTLPVLGVFVVTQRYLREGLALGSGR